MRWRRRITPQELFIAIFFGAGLAILMFLYKQFGVTTWLLAILAGLFVLGIVGATIDEIRIRRRRREREGPLPSRAKIR